MSEDKEVTEIKEKKLKEKAQAVKAEQDKTYTPDEVIFMLTGYMRKAGLDLVNTAEGLESQIRNIYQRKINDQNKGK